MGVFNLREMALDIIIWLLRLYKVAPRGDACSINPIDYSSSLHPPQAQVDQDYKSKSSYRGHPCCMICQVIAMYAQYHMGVSGKIGILTNGHFMPGTLNMMTILWAEVGTGTPFLSKPI